MTIIVLFILLIIQREVKSLNRVCLSAHDCVSLLEETTDDLLHIVKIVGALDLCLLIVVTLGVVEGGCLVVFKLHVTVRGELL